MMVIEIKFDGEDNEGLPDATINDVMNDFEDALIQQLPDANGYLNIGRETYNSTRTIYFACKEFRHSSKTVSSLIKKYQQQLEITYDIFKDKYWIAVNHLKTGIAE
jgi:hypothetical protein